MVFRCVDLKGLGTVQTNDLMVFFREVLSKIIDI